MIRANIIEDAEATITRFLNGLNKETCNVIELQYYIELKDMIHMAIKIKRHLKRKESIY